MQYDQDNRGYGDRGGGYGGGGGGRGGYRTGPREGYGGQGGQGGPPRERRGTPLSDLDPAITEVSRKVIGFAIEVHMALGPGYDESVYTAALRQELDAAGIAHRAGHTFQVNYKGKQIGQTTADLFVDNRFLVEVMARPGEIGGYERAALRSQLRAADVELGLIINFGERRLKDGLVRVLNPDKLNANKGEGGSEGAGEHAEEGEYEEEQA